MLLAKKKKIMGKKRIKIYIFLNLSTENVVGVSSNLSVLTRKISNDKASYPKIYHKIKILNDDEIPSFSHIFEENGEKFKIFIKFLNE